MLKVLDGSRTELAPRPKRHGPTRLLYDVVDAMGGEATTAEIKKYLPAAVTDAKDVITQKKLNGALKRCVYLGYLVVLGDKYKVAPMAYYESRQDYVKELRDKYNKKDPSELIKRARGASPFVVSQTNWWATATLSLLGFIVGFLIGQLF